MTGGDAAPGDPAPADRPRPGRPRRPASLPPGAFESAMGLAPDPAAIVEAAHHSASVLVGHGRAADDPQVTARLVAIMDEVGLEEVARLWAQRPAQSLPGALWRLYVLREWVRRHPHAASRDFAEGRRFADVSVVVAGVADPPGPAEVQTVADDILRGVFEGDLAVALHRAAAFARVVAAGRGSADPVDLGTETPGAETPGAQNDRAGHGVATGPGGPAAPGGATSGLALLEVASDLDRAAAAWRAGTLR